MYGSVLSDPVCVSDRVVTKYQTETLISGPGHKVWSKTGPCFKNGTDEHCVYHSSTFAKGRGTSILTTPERAAYIAKSEAFRLSEEELRVRNKMTSKVKVVPIPGKEYGVVATERIFRGDRIISETVSLMIDYGSFEDVPSQDLLRIQGVGVDYLPTNHRLRYLNMSTHGADVPYLEKIEKILVTNAFDVELDDEEEDSFYAIFAESELP
jgi:hypothetical protein